VKISYRMSGEFTTLISYKFIYGVIDLNKF
jgi:hypothetical protein